MANIASSEKKNRQRIRHRQRNLLQLTRVRTYVKRVRAAVVAKDAKAKDLLKAAIKLIDKAAQKGLIKKQTASRKVSRLTRHVAGAGAAAAK